MRKGCPTEPPREGGSSPSSGVYKPSCQVLPNLGSHTLVFSKSPGPGQEAWWRPEGGGLSNPQLLKRANREVKIGNKNKIAPATLLVCVGNKASPGPAGRAQLQPLPDKECPSPTSSCHQDFNFAPRARQGAPQKGIQNQVRIPVEPITSHVTSGKALGPSPGSGFFISDRGADPPPGTISPPQKGCPTLGLPHTSLCPPGSLQAPPHVRTHWPPGGQPGGKSPH